MDEKLISIIVPAYNLEQYIESCLRSILNQTYKNIEIIVVDDGSTDSTAEIIDAMAQENRRIVTIHKENGGVSSARQAGIDKATGDYIGFVDGDDFVEPEMYEHLLENLLKYDADISHCGYQMVFPDGHVDMYYNTGKIVEQSHSQGITDLLEGIFVEPGLVNKLFKHSIVSGFATSSLWDTTIRINEDLLMNYLFFSKADKSIYEDIPFYHYILRKGSATTSKKQLYKINDPVRVANCIMKDLIGNDAQFKIAYKRYLRTLITVAMQNSWKEEAKKARKMLRVEVKKKRFPKECDSLKLCFMTVGVSYNYPLYKIIRWGYDLVTGVSKKYDI